MLVARRENLLTVDHVAVAFAARRSLDTGRFRARIGFGDANGLQAQFARRYSRQVAPLLLDAAMLQNRGHRVHLSVTDDCVAAAVIDFLENQRRLQHTESRAAVLLRAQRREPSGLAHRADELVGIGSVLVARAPVIIAESSA